MYLNCRSCRTSIPTKRRGNHNNNNSMKIIRLTSPLSDVLRLSSPKPRLRHGRRLALLFHPDLCTLFFVFSLALFPSLLASPTVPLLGSRLRSSPISGDLTFLSASQMSCVTEPEATFPSSAEQRALSSITRPFFSPFFPSWISCCCLQPLRVHCHWPR